MLAWTIFGLLTIFLVPNNNAESWTCGILYLFTCSNDECLASARASIENIAGLNATALQELIEFSCTDEYKLVGPAFVMCDTFNRKLMSHVFPMCNPLMLTDYTANNTEITPSESDSKGRKKTKVNRYKYKYRKFSHCDVTIHNYVILGLIVATAVLIVIIIMLIVCFAKSRKRSLEPPEQVIENKEEMITAPKVPPRAENTIYMSVLENENSEYAYMEPPFADEVRRPVVENLYEEYVTNRIQFEYGPIESHL